MDGETSLTNSLNEALSLLKTIHEGQQEDRDILHEQRSTLQNAVQAQTANFAYHESVVQENADLKERITGIIAEKEELNDRVTEALAENVEMEKKHAEALTQKSVVEKNLSEILARHSRLEKKHIEMTAQKEEADKNLFNSLQENIELKVRLGARDFRERDTQEALSQVLPSSEGKDVASQAERFHTKGSETTQSLQRQSRSIRFSNSYEASIDRGVGKDLTASRSSVASSSLQRKRRNSSMSQDELAAEDSPNPKRSKTSARDSESTEAVGLSEVTNRMRFYRQAEGTRHSFDELAEAVKSALEPHLQFFAKKTHFISFCRESQGGTKCARMRVKSKKPKAISKPEAPHTCKFCLGQKAPCVLVAKGYPPTLVPLPADLRVGKEEDDPEYWIPNPDYEMPRPAWSF